LRSYIFTPAEREAIRSFIEGRIGFSNAVLRRLKYRMEEFRELAEDVQLYMRFKDALAKSEAAVPT
jgi:hypothetical protein